MKIITDTNILLRLLVNDDEKQLKIVSKLLKNVESIIIPTHVFCELVWVLSAGYKLKPEHISEKIKGLLQSHKVIVKEDEVEAGLRMMELGGDFADGVNAYTGQSMARGQAVFASFDKQAVRLLVEQGLSAIVPGG
jgi:predicted nucleic-acid-binding protein